MNNMARPVTLVIVVAVWLIALTTWFVCHLNLVDVGSIGRFRGRGGAHRISESPKRNGSNVIGPHSKHYVESATSADRPLLILHVGPQKTNSSGIQEFAFQNEETLERDNIYFLGHFLGRPESNWNDLSTFCTRGPERNCTNSWKKLETSLDLHHTLHHNVFISYDWFSAIRKDADAEDFLWKPLLPLFRQWRVRVVFTYRRLHEWLPHNYYQLNGAYKTLDKWPGNGGRHMPSFPSVFDRVASKKSKHPKALLKIWQNRLSSLNYTEIRLFNYHKQENFLANFYCHMIPEASQVCKLLSDSPKEETKHLADYENDLHYDMLAIAAYRKGWLEKSLSRLDVVRATEQHAKALQYRVRKDYPLVCLSDEHADQLLNLSLAMERDMLPKFYASNAGAQNLRFTFHNAKQSNLFCSVNADEVIKDTRWQVFFQGLTDETVQQPDPVVKSSNGETLPIDFSDLDVNISFLGIGAQGAGTSWLHQMMLVSCPHQINFGVKKEIHFWDWNRHKGLAWYSEQFPDRHLPGLFHGEITPHYMSLSEHDIAEIRLLFPHIKIIFQARDMVDRAWSHLRKNLRHQRRKGNTNTFDPADFSDEYFVGKAGDASHQERSNYDLALRRWYKHFPQDQVMILNFDEIKTNPVKLMEQVLAFIGVDVKQANMTAVQEASDEPVNTGAFGSELRPSLRDELEDMYRPHAVAFNALLKEQGYTWELSTYPHNASITPTN